MLTEEKREQLLELSTALAVDAMDRLGLQESVLNPKISPVVPFTRMVGTRSHRSAEIPTRSRQSGPDGLYQGLRDRRGALLSDHRR